MEEEHACLRGLVLRSVVSSSSSNNNYDAATYIYNIKRNFDVSMQHLIMFEKVDIAHIRGK